ncbi:acyl-CoA thioesterase [Ohtaekwangia sp.]|uniref:acyl-CoA thioesterase n=1 Tax=Ohtaekwangia sp. TaxID=2066019 RepID=UPI002F94D57C
MVTPFNLPIQIRWSDIDQNRHLRHSAYYDYGAMARMIFLSEHGITTQKLDELKIGPILFREEALFKREITLDDKITLDVELTRAAKDFSRWSLRHNFFKQDGTLAANVTVDGAWIDLERRKLAIPNEFIQGIFSEFPRAAAFEWIIREEKKA